MVKQKYKNNNNNNEIININKLVKVVKIDLSDEQRNGLIKILDFMTNKTNICNSFLLCGYAGTGKTTLLIESINCLIQNKIINSVVLTAPTNKAVNILKLKLKDYIRDIYLNLKNQNNNKDVNNDINLYNLDDKYNNISIDEILYILKNIYGIRIHFTTTHKLLNYSVKYDDNGNRYFIKKNTLNNKSKNINYNLVVVDECSMIPINLAEELLNNNKNKFIFCGDPAQLPPVKEKSSIIFNKINDDNKSNNIINYTEFINYLNNSNKILFDDNYDNIIYDNDDIKKRYEFICNKLQLINNNNNNNILLSNIIRNNINNVINMSNEIRLWINNLIQYPDFSKYKSKGGVFYYKIINKDKLNSEWFKKYINSINNNINSDENIIITWTNKQTNEYNNKIRNILFKNSKNTFEIGDILIMNELYEACEFLNLNNNNNNNNNEIGKLNTSEQIKVLDIKKDTKYLNIFNNKLNVLSPIKNSITEDLNIIKIFNVYIKLINELIIKTKLLCWTLTVTKFNTISDKNDIQYIIYVLDDKYDNRFNILCNNIKNNIKGLENDIRKVFSKKYDKNNIKTFIIKPLWNEYYNIINKFANVNYGYSISCHKTQGSTYKNVYIDLENILKNQNISEMKRCFYTAITRASNEVNILI